MDLELQEFPAEKPTNRGRFSPDRARWDQIHQQRYLQWQLGDSIQQIADDEVVAYNAVKRSIQLCEGHLPGAEITSRRHTRLRLITFDRLHEQYTTVMEGLMSDPNPVVRLKALDCFRKTMADPPAGVQVNTHVNVAQDAASAWDFETAVSEIRRKQKACHERQVIDSGKSE